MDIGQVWLKQPSCTVQAIAEDTVKCSCFSPKRRANLVVGRLFFPPRQTFPDGARTRFPAATMAMEGNGWQAARVSERRVAPCQKLPNQLVIPFTLSGWLGPSKVGKDDNNVSHPRGPGGRLQMEMAHGIRGRGSVCISHAAPSKTDWGRGVFRPGCSSWSSPFKKVCLAMVRERRHPDTVQPSRN